jgi:hypothetical protein
VYPSKVELTAAPLPSNRRFFLVDQQTVDGKRPRVAVVPARGPSTGKAEVHVESAAAQRSLQRDPDTEGVLIRQRRDVQARTS